MSPERKLCDQRCANVERQLICATQAYMSSTYAHTHTHTRITWLIAHRPLKATEPVRIWVNRYGAVFFGCYSPVRVLSPVQLLSEESTSTCPLCACVLICLSLIRVRSDSTDCRANRRKPVPVSDLTWTRRIRTRETIRFVVDMLKRSENNQCSRRLVSATDWLTPGRCCDAMFWCNAVTIECRTGEW